MAVLTKEDRLALAWIKVNRLNTELDEAWADIEVIKNMIEEPVQVVPPKTLAEEVETITTFGFGLENYAVVNGTHVRVKK